jgi:hypothetical protein
VLQQHLLAVEAPDAGGAAAGRDVLLVARRREDLVQVEDGTDLGGARIRAALARRVGHHRAHLRADDFGRIGQLDVVAIGLRHLASVGPRHLRDLRELGVGLGEHRTEGGVEAARHLAGQLDVRHLIDADRHPPGLVHEDVRRLQQRIAQQPVGG